MPALFIYLLKANVALVLFYLAYRFVLRRLTFYTLNRYFLLLAIFLSALFPLISLRDLFNPGTGLVEGVTYYALDWRAIGRKVQQPEHFTVWSMLAYLFWAGVLVMGVRFLIQLTSLIKIHVRSKDGAFGGQRVMVVQDALNPFSFFRNIYVNPRMHQPCELTAIIEHEKIHVRGWHSADILTGELNQIFYWFNPGAWLIRKAIGENLEFITDQTMLRSGADPKSYQYSLVRISSVPYASHLANNFNFAHLKKRILMMNKKRSSRVHLVRYLVVVPLVALAALVITTSRAQNKTISLLLVPGQQTKTPDTDSIAEVMFSETQLAPDNQLFLKRNPAVLGSESTTDTERQARSVTLQLKSGYSGIYGQGKPSDPGKEKQQNGILLSPSSVSQVFHAAGGRIALAHASGKFDRGPVTGSAGKIFIKEHPDSLPAPVFVVDGKAQDPTFSIESIPPDHIESITVLKKGSGTALYGARGKNGVIMLKTKPETNTVFIKDPVRGDSGFRRVTFDRVKSGDSMPHMFYDKDREIVVEGHPTRDSFYVGKDRSYPAVIGYASTHSRSYSSGHLSEVTVKEGKNPLYVVNFNIVDSSYMRQNVKPQNIQSIDVVKGDRAIKLFGKKGENGVILITTKQPISVRTRDQW